MEEESVMVSHSLISSIIGDSDTNSCSSMDSSFAVVGNGQLSPGAPPPSITTAIREEGAQNGNRYEMRPDIKEVCTFCFSQKSFQTYTIRKTFEKV